MIQGFQQLSIVSFDFSGSVTTILEENDSLKKVVADDEAKTRYVDVKTAISNLTQVDKLLNVAYAGTKGFPCCSLVIDIKLEYQSLVHDSALACNEFISSCFQAIKNHQIAIRLAEKGTSLQKCVTFIGKCQELAKRMAEESENLKTKAHNLHQKSSEALKTVTDQQSVSITKKKEIDQRLNNFKSRQAKLISTQADLTRYIEEEREKEKEIANLADKAEQRAFVISLISTVIPVDKVVKLASNLFKNNTLEDFMEKLKKNTRNENDQKAKDLVEEEKKLAVKKTQLNQERKKEDSNKGQIDKLELEIAELSVTVDFKRTTAHSSEATLKALENRLDKKIDSYREVQSKIAKTRADLQKLQMETNADLAETIENLKNKTAENNDLDKVINALDVTVQTLGRVETIFLNVQDFWITIKKRSEKLTSHDLAEFVEEDIKDEFIRGLNESGLDWFTLGKINFDAGCTLQKVKESVDRTMSNLPSMKESIKLIEDFKLEPRVLEIN